MANKIYTVVKDGKELEKYKSLPAAKKRANAEGAEVFLDGKCVYQGVVETEKVVENVEAVETTQETVDATAEVAPDTTEEETGKEPDSDVVVEEPVTAPESTDEVIPSVDITAPDPTLKTQEKPYEPETTRYRLKGLMNVRKKPSLKAQIVDTRPEGSVVRVLAIEGDWMRLANDTYILYEGGKWAEKLNG